MKTFEVLTHPTLGTEAIKVGFNWPALLFGLWWSLVKKLWLNALLYFVLFVILNGIATELEQEQAVGPVLFVYLLMLWLAVFWGLNGNKWVVNSLQKRGFTIERTVEATSNDAAIAQFVRNQ